MQHDKPFFAASQTLRPAARHPQPVSAALKNQRRLPAGQFWDKMMP